MLGPKNPNQLTSGLFKTHRPVSSRWFFPVDRAASDAQVLFDRPLLGRWLSQAGRLGSGAKIRPSAFGLGLRGRRNVWCFFFWRSKHFGGDWSDSFLQKKWDDFWTKKVTFLSNCWFLFDVDICVSFQWPEDS